MRHLYIAYLATWIIHIGYLFALTRRALKLRQDAEDLSRER